jgi:trimeric autotransporter adhesin
MNSSVKKDLRKVESACMLALLLLPGIFIALPAVSLLGASASTGATPLAVTGATAAIDYPIYGSISNGAPTTDTRTITVSNPVGNPGITTITISVPAAAVGVSSTVAGTIPTTGGVPDCSGTACNAKVFGTGPYSLQYCDTTGTNCGTAVILPPGATIKLTISFAPETNTVSSSAADTYTLSASVTDTTGANTVLNSLAIYETKATTVTGTNPSATTYTAGTVFTFTASLNQTGVPLYAGAHSVTNAGTPTVSPASYTSGSSAQTISVNDTTAEVDTFGVGGPKPNVLSNGNGVLGNFTTQSETITAGASSAVSITILGNSNKHQVNMTSTALISGASISVSSTDKYGNNVVQTSGLLVTLTTSTLSGRAAGFTAATTMGVSPSSSTYPYTPSDLSVTAQFYISAGQSTNTSNKNFYFGPDYGSTSAITASASGVTPQTSGDIVTWTFQSGAPTIAVTGGLSVKAGSNAQIEVSLPSGTGLIQGNVPVYVSIPLSANSSDYKGTFAGSRAVKTTTVGNSTFATATVQLTVDTKVNAFAQVTAVYGVSPTSNSSATTSGAITTIAASFSKITIKTYFDTTQLSATSAVKSGGTLYIDACASDAYGNPLTVTGIVQITLSTSAGSMSSNTAYLTTGKSCITASGYQVSLVAPTTVGTTVTLSASGTYAGSVASGSTAVAVVASSPVIGINSVPSSVTTGIAQSVTGTANASTGIQSDVISTLEYSLNGGTNVSLAAGSQNNTFTITVIFPNAHNSIQIYAQDSAGTWTTVIVLVPPLPPPQTFTAPTGAQPAQYQFPSGGPQSVNSTFTNNGASSLTIVVIANIFTSAGVPVTPSPTATATVPAGSTVSTFELLNGLPHGTYTVTINVYSTQYVSLSPTYTVTVTV